jgi:hypothetical protein
VAEGEDKLNTLLTSAMEIKTGLNYGYWFW